MESALGKKKKTKINLLWKESYLILKMITPSDWVTFEVEGSSIIPTQEKLFL